MTRSRKTISVDDIIERANRIMRVTPDEMTVQRKEIALFVEELLFSVDRYKGFSYLDSEWDSEAWALRDGYDDTRRRYFK